MVTWTEDGMGLVVIAGVILWSTGAIPAGLVIALAIWWAWMVT